MDKTIDILLVYPKLGSDSPYNLTPLSILYPGALFEQQGKRVEYFDDRFDKESTLKELIKKSREIGVSSFTGYQTGRAAQILELAKSIDPDIIAGVGGHHARILPKQVLAEPFVDKIWTDDSYGEHLFPYNERTKIHFQRTDMQYFTSRGCPFNCSFCALRSEWIPKDCAEVDRELKIIHNDIGFEDISFSDPNIVGGSKINKGERIMKIGKILRDINVKWDGNIRCPDVTPEMVEALNYSNCATLEVGCESGNDYFLKNIIRKGHGVSTIKEVAKNVKGANFSVMYSFIANMPGETKEMLFDTLDLIDWIVANDPKARISIFNFAPYPGTPMYEYALEGRHDYPKFDPPKSMKEWGNFKLMSSSLYWIAGLNFRLDNTRKNFPGQDWAIIEPYVNLARKKWIDRDLLDFPCEEVEGLIKAQKEKTKV